MVGLKISVTVTLTIRKINLWKKYPIEAVSEESHLSQKTRQGWGNHVAARSSPVAQRPNTSFICTEPYPRIKVAANIFSLRTQEARE
jgi:hypothetical protein